MHFSYHTLGLDIEARFPCPGLAPASGPAFGRPVVVETGAVPEVMADPVCRRPLTWIDRSGAVLHRIPGLARFLMVRGRIVAAVEGDTDPARLPGFLCDLPLPLQACQWGLVPLDAGCVAMAEGAVLLAGPPAVGRTTLALALVALGARLMADRCCVVDGTDRVHPLVLPAAPTLSVWPEAAPSPGLGRPSALGPGGRAALGCAGVYEPRPLPVRAVVSLRPAVRPMDPQRRQGARAFETVMSLARAAELTRTLLGEPSRLAAMTALAAAARVLVVPYGPSLGTPEAQAGALITLLRGEGVF